MGLTSCHYSSAQKYQMVFSFVRNLCTLALSVFFFFNVLWYLIEMYNCPSWLLDAFSNLAGHSSIRSVCLYSWNNSIYQSRSSWCLILKGLKIFVYTFQLWWKSDKNKGLLHKRLYAHLHIFREQVVKYLSVPKNIPNKFVDENETCILCRMHFPR